MEQGSQRPLAREPGNSGNRKCRPAPEDTQIQSETGQTVHPSSEDHMESVQEAKLRGLSLRAIARELGIHRETAKKYALAARLRIDQLAPLVSRDYPAATALAWCG